MRIRLLLAAGIAGFAMVARADALAIRTGLWLMTYTSQVSGANAAAASGPHTQHEKICVTPADLKQGAFRGEDDADAACKYTLVTQTGSQQEMSFVCGGDQPHSGAIKVEAVNPTAVRGTMQMDSAGRKLTLQLSGTWQSASCAGADDD